MEKNELIECSPARCFQSITSPLKPGEFGLITAKKGLGKTSILVQFGIDFLLQDKELVHVSFDQQSSNVISWYSSVISEIIKRKNISNPAELTESIFKNRTILNFNQENFSLPKVANTIKALNENGMKIQAMVIDGLDLEKTSQKDLQTLAEYSKTAGIVIWFSYTCEENTLEKTLPSEIIDLFSIVGHVAADGENVLVTVLKGGSAQIKIDTKTSLMTKL